MSSPSVQAINSSDPNIPITSDPSIRAIKKTSKWLQFALIFLVLFALCALVLTIILFINETNTNKQDAATQEALARETKRINATPLQTEEDNAVDAVEDDGRIFFSLFTTPAGADVYQNDTYIGTTPINQKRLTKSDEQADFIIALEGYELVRKPISLKSNFSDSVTLTKIIVQAAAPTAKEENDAIIQNNNAVIVTAPQADKAANNKKKSKTKTKEAAPVDMGIALPD